MTDIGPELAKTIQTIVYALAIVLVFRQCSRRDR